MSIRHHLSTRRITGLGLKSLAGGCSCALFLGLSTTPAIAGTTGEGLLVQNQIATPVSIDPGSTAGNASCVDNWGNVPGLYSGLNEGQNNATTNPITVEFVNNGSCGAVSPWLFPFTITVGGNEVPTDMVSLNGNSYVEPWCTFGTSDQYPPQDSGEYPTGEVGATNMSCLGDYVGNDAEVTASYWMSPNPLVIYGSGFDVVMNAISPVDKSVPPNGCENSAGWHDCLTVQVVPEGTSIPTQQEQSYRVPISGTSGSGLTTAASSQPTTPDGMFPVDQHLPRQDIFGSIPKTGKVSESMHNGQLSVTSSMSLGSDAKALLKRIGSARVHNWVTLSAGVGSGTQTLSGTERHVLATGALTSQARNRTETVVLSKSTSSQLCTAIATGTAAKLTVTASQFIAEPLHTYDMDSAKKITLKKCPTG